MHWHVARVSQRRPTNNNNRRELEGQDQGLILVPRAVIEPAPAPDDEEDFGPAHPITSRIEGRLREGYSLRQVIYLERPAILDFCRAVNTRNRNVLYGYHIEAILRGDTKEADELLEIIHSFSPDSLLPVPAKASTDPKPLHENESTTAMATSSIHSTLPLPVLPQDWSAENNFKALGTLSPAVQRNIEPVGPQFLAYARRKKHRRTFSEDDRIQAQENVKKVEDEDSGEISEPEDPMMLQRDAKDWKGQDHYAVLGLSKYRYKATEEQIKRAHRKKVLKHHPDKRAAAGGTEDDSFFKCIQKAMEILLDPTKRRQFDSVDTGADKEPPTKKEAGQSPKHFFRLWGPVFESEARFSKVQPVPMLGDTNSTKDHVEHFYNFWYSFDSWRSFEYLDEDVPDDNENRDQKRHVERKNNNARKKRKTEDTARLRRLVDDCLAGDERIKRFRAEERAGKNKKRLEREEAERKAKEEAVAKKKEDERLAKEKEETEKAEKADAKKAKEAAKNAVKKNKRVLKGSVKDVNYFVAAGTDPNAKVVDDVLNDVDLVVGKMDPEEIGSLAAKLGGKKDAGVVRAAWKEEVTRLVSAGKMKDGEAKMLVGS
ncbi:MAG: hypothetical protein LQ340_001114 [Diploschistes diacapsis]|nr:MAG: hypothetical protein LQ340_001114 [Diploschistes diacapsis]